MPKSIFGFSLDWGAIVNLITILLSAIALFYTQAEWHQRLEDTIAQITDDVKELKGDVKSQIKSVALIKGKLGIYDHEAGSH